MGPLRAYLCGEPEEGRDDELSLRHFIRRNAAEDVALARQKNAGATLLRGLATEPVSFCTAESLKSDYGPEWLLRGRDALYRGSVSYY